MKPLHIYTAFIPIASVFVLLLLQHFSNCHTVPLLNASCMKISHIATTSTHAHILHFAWTHLLLPWHPTHLVSVLWIHLQFFNQVACHLTVAPLGCPVQHAVPIAVLLMDPCPKLWRQELDHLQLPTFCSLVHGILAVLYRVTKQM